MVETKVALMVGKMVEYTVAMMAEMKDSRDTK